MAEESAFRSLDFYWREKTSQRVVTSPPRADEKTVGERGLAEKEKDGVADIGGSNFCHLRRR